MRAARALPRRHRPISAFSISRNERGADHGGVRKAAEHGDVSWQRNAEADRERNICDERARDESATEDRPGANL